MSDYDLTVIGGGPGGYRAAITAAHLGARVVLIEKGMPGGTCLNLGCIPKKALLHLANLLENCNELGGRGLVGGLHGDFRQAMAHKDEVVNSIRGNFPVWLKRFGIQVVSAAARIESAGDEIVVALQPERGNGSDRLSTSRVVIATGSRPRRLELCPGGDPRVITSQEFMTTLEDLPDNLLFVGGGPVSAELAYFAHQFGSGVTIVERERRLLSTVRLPERAVGFLERKFKRLGIAVKLGTRVASCTAHAHGIVAAFSDGDSRVFDAVLVATGREPSTAGLGLEETGVALSPEGFIETSEYLETSVPGIYAAGDVHRGPMTANAALHDAKIAATNALLGNQMKCNYLKVPVVINSALEIAAIGFTEDQAEAAGFEPEVARASLGGCVKARAQHDYEGFFEVLHDTKTGQMLGGCIVGPEAGEQIHLLSAACQSTRGMWLFKDMCYSHPSWCEELETAIDPYTAALSRSGRELFTPGILAML
jgi:dihydrolipoamide dehydrogenase